MKNETIKVLVIDDFEDDVMLCKRALEKCKDVKYLIREQTSVEKTLDSIKEFQPECLLLDYFMPGRNGLEMLRDIRAKHPFLAVVMMTGQVNERVAVDAIHEGAQNYISKSLVTSESLDRIIHLAIENCMMQKRLYEQRMSLEVFTRALAHDLKEPVRTISSFAKLIIENEKLSTVGEKYFDLIQNSADRMNNLIDVVHLYTKLDSPIQVKKEDCDSFDILHEVKEGLSKLLEEKEAVITTGYLPIVYANKTQMLQVFQNLISNSIKHNTDKVYIHINAEEYSDNWMFSFADNGVGIEEPSIDEVFDPFKRLVSVDKSGMGMGLAICKKIIESMGGKIWVKSRPGEGATFYFTIPKMESQNTMPEVSIKEFESKAKANKKDGNMLNVLLVDDHDADLMITKFYLFEQPKLNCNLLVAHNGKEALNLFSKHAKKDERIDMVLIDINMPGMTGFDLLKKMKEEGRLNDTVAIMCTGSAYDKDIEMARLLGAAGYLIKPVQFDKLKNVIEETHMLNIAKHDNNYTLERAA